jgi:hypothetical protein
MQWMTVARNQRLRGLIAQLVVTRHAGNSDRSATSDERLRQARIAHRGLLLSLSRVYLYSGSE